MRSFHQKYLVPPRTKELKTSGVILNRVDKDSFIKSSKFIWDTGATDSCINKKLVETLGLQVFSNEQIITVNGTILCNTYYVDIVLPNKITIPKLLVPATHLDSSTDFLVGMDIIGRGSFLFTEGHIFEFCIPSYPYKRIKK